MLPVVSLLAFGQPLPEDLICELDEESRVSNATLKKRGLWPSHADAPNIRLVGPWREEAYTVARLSHVHVHS